MTRFAMKAAGFLGVSLALGCVAAVAQTGAGKPGLQDAGRGGIRLEPSGEDTSAAALKGPVQPAVAPANFRHLGEARVGELAKISTLRLRFATATKLGKISSTADFKVEQGSSCVEGNEYAQNATCTLLVRFTPQGAGRRLGRVTIERSGSATPYYVGLGGNGYAPVINFTPAVMSTVPASVVSGKGLLNGAQNMAVDGGDTLYVSDTGNNVVRAMDSSGRFATISTGTLAAPLGIAVDNFGDVYFDEPASNLAFEIFNYGSQIQISGSGTDTCTVAAPCSMPSEKLFKPGQMAMDANNNLFFVDQALGAAMALTQPFQPKLGRLYDPFTFQNTAPGVITVDAYDNIYSLWSTTGVCQLVSQYFSDAANTHGVYKKVAGGRFCGFAGDGGQARNAEISAKVGQMTFDVAGNLYFTDQGNQRVRKIDSATGIITTIAGTGTAGNSGDGGASTLSQLNQPAGLAVDSQGQVYVTSNSATTGAAQVIRKLGVDGALPFASQVKGTTSAAQTVKMSNNGNADMNLTEVHIVGAAASDFVIDPNTTSCVLTAGAVLPSGHSCKIGVLFKPTNSGVRTATIEFLDDTVNNVNNVQLYGVGSLAAATVAIISPSSGASFKTGTTVGLSVSVTSVSGAAPTGTVKFLRDGVVYGSPVTLAGGKASMNYTGLPAGTHTLGAIYSGDANYAPSGTVSRAVTITAAAKAASYLTLTPKRDAACGSEVLTALVTAKAGGVPTGVVQLRDGTKIVASAALKNGAVNLVTGVLSAGAHNLNAYYPGDSAHNASSGSTIANGTSGACRAIETHPVRETRLRR